MTKAAKDDLAAFLRVEREDRPARIATRSVAGGGEFE